MFELVKFDRRREELVSRAPVAAQIAGAIESLDWTSGDIVGVMLRHDRSNWADGSGSLAEGVGLSLILEDNAVQHVSASAPESLDEVRDFLNVYLDGDIHRAFEIIYGHDFTTDELAELRYGEPAEGGTAVVLVMLGMVVLVFGVLWLVLT